MKDVEATDREQPFGGPPEQVTQLFEQVAELESRYTIWEAIRKLVSVWREWKRAAFGPHTDAFFINKRESSQSRGRIKTNTGSLKKAYASEKIETLYVSITVPDNPTFALADAIKKLARVSPTWKRVTRFELEIILTRHSYLELIRSPRRYEDHLEPAFKAITKLLPGPLEFVASDMSACSVVAQLFSELDAHFNTTIASRRSVGLERDIYDDGELTADQWQSDYSPVSRHPQAEWQ